MRRIQLLTLSALAILSAILLVPLAAADTVDVPWQQICYKALNHEMVITTASGDSLEGYCSSVDAAGVSLTIKGKVVRVMRGSVSRLMIYTPRHRLRALGHEMMQSLRTGFAALLTPSGPVALASIPATLAWGAVSAPFCILGDLVGRTDDGVELRTQ
jgi:hypothetical protein